MLQYHKFTAEFQGEFSNIGTELAKLCEQCSGPFFYTYRLHSSLALCFGSIVYIRRRVVTTGDNVIVMTTAFNVYSCIVTGNFRPRQHDAEHSSML